MSFQVALDALTSDAQRWDDTGHVLSRAADAANGMVVAPADFSFLGGDVHDAYEKGRSFMAAFLSDGSKEAFGAASALREVRQEYEDADKRTVDRLAKEWQSE